MASAWVGNGPIALPSRGLAYGAGVAVVLFAMLGVGLGFQAAWRKSAAPDLDAASSAGAGKDDALTARPIVDLAPPAAAPDTAKDDAEADNEADKADALAAQTAAAQAIQAKAAKDGGSIDDVLTSPTEKPPTVAKGGADEAPPGVPVKSDVPF